MTENELHLDVGELAELLAGALLGDDDAQLTLEVRVDGRTVPVHGATYDHVTQTLTVHGGYQPYVTRSRLRPWSFDDRQFDVPPTDAGRVGLDLPQWPDPLDRRRRRDSPQR